MINPRRNPRNRPVIREKLLFMAMPYPDCKQRALGRAQAFYALEIEKSYKQKGY
jgi:hypothetical protein